jgi:hypothetical protein
VPDPPGLDAAACLHRHAIPALKVIWGYVEIRLVTFGSPIRHVTLCGELEQVTCGFGIIEVGESLALIV